MVDVIRQYFDSEPSPEISDKIMGLPEAVERYVEPGKVIFFGEFANAAAREIARQFKGSNAGFTIVNSARDYLAPMVYDGLVKKLIGVAYMHLYPKSGPNRVIQDAFNKGRIEIEGWTSLTLMQRLMAGAMDLECMVTKSLLGSDMALDNKDALHLFESPFKKKQELALLEALNPDIAVVHGWMADASGNIILGSPYYMGTGTWGARASKGGVVATVEKIVSKDFIRKHSALVSIPGHMVNSVSEVPYGAHPQGMNCLGLGISGLTSYRPDNDFIGNYRDTVSDAAKLKAWMNEWIYDCPSQEIYLSKLGEKRLHDLSSGIGENEGKASLDEILANVSFRSEFSRNELTIVAAARKIEEIVLEKKYINFLLGVGFSALSGWLAYYGLKKKDRPVKLLIGTGVYGYSPQPGNPTIGATANIETGEMLSDAFQSYGSLVGGYNNRCLSVLGAAQVDKYGNINSSRIDNKFIAGSGGANDSTSAEEVMVVSRQSVKRFVDRVEYITSPGTRVKTIVSDLGIFEKLGEDKDMTLTGLHYDGGNASLEERVKMVKDNCGWELKVAVTPKIMHPPGMEELALLRCFDPDRLYR